MPTILKAQTVFVFKKYLYKLTIDNNDLVGEKIHIYTKFTYLTKFNNICIET